MAEKIRANFYSEINNVPKKSHFREIKKGVTIWRLYSTSLRDIFEPNLLEAQILYLDHQLYHLHRYPIVRMQLQLHDVPENLVQHNTF